jgi:hypothetical protein
MCRKVVDTRRPRLRRAVQLPQVAQRPLARTVDRSHCPHQRLACGLIRDCKSKLHRAVGDFPDDFATFPQDLQANDLVKTALIIYTCRRIYAYMTKNAVSDPQTTRLTITWSKEADHALRTFLGSQGMKKGDLSKFIEEAVRWRIFHQTVREAREAFADVSPDKLQNMIDQAVEELRTKHYRERAKRS